MVFSDWLQAAGIGLFGQFLLNELTARAFGFLFALQLALLEKLVKQLPGILVLPLAQVAAPRAGFYEICLIFGRRLLRIILGRPLWQDQRNGIAQHIILRQIFQFFLLVIQVELRLLRLRLVDADEVRQLFLVGLVVQLGLVLLRRQLFLGCFALDLVHAALRSLVLLLGHFLLVGIRIISALTISVPDDHSEGAAAQLQLRKAQEPEEEQVFP